MALNNTSISYIPQQKPCCLLLSKSGVFPLLKQYCTVGGKDLIVLTTMDDITEGRVGVMTLKMTARQ